MSRIFGRATRYMAWLIFHGTGRPPSSRQCTRRTSLKPRSIPHAQAAALPLSALTAWQALFEHAHLAVGQAVLIHGGAGGGGTLAVQLARWRGAHVLATASAHDPALVRSPGADDVIDYHATRFEDILRDIDVVLNTIGGETLLSSAGQPVEIIPAKANAVPGSV